MNANKRLHTTATALAGFFLFFFSKRLGGFPGCVLPVRARLRLVKRGVRRLLVIRFFESGWQFGLMVAMRSPTEPSTTGSAPRHVRCQPKTYVATHKEKVVVHTAMRFLRFQSPWADGENLFALRCRAPADTWVNIRHQRTEVTERWRVRDELTFSLRENMRIGVVKNAVLILRDDVWWCCCRGSEMASDRACTRV